MTVLAWDGKTLSADRMVSNRQVDLHYPTEKIQILHTPMRGTSDTNSPVFTAVAAAGRIHPMFKFIQLLQDASRRGETYKQFREGIEKYSPIPFQEWSFSVFLIGLNAKGEPVFAEVTKHLYELRPPFSSFGSGSDFLRRNSEAFKDSKEMVVTACFMDSCCGFKLDTYDPVTKKLSTMSSYPVSKRKAIHKRLIDNFSKQIAGILDETIDGHLHVKKD